MCENAYSTRHGMDFWALALLGMGVGTIGTGINLMVTIFQLRTPGMSLCRLPLFVWMVLVNPFLIVFALPALNASLVMRLIDRQLNALQHARVCREPQARRVECARAFLQTRTDINVQK